MTDAVTDSVVGVRLGRNDPIIFCSTALPSLQEGQQVTVTIGEDVHAATVAIAPQAVIAADLQPGAPRVVGADAALPVEIDDHSPPGVTFLPAGDGATAVSDLAQALRLAAIPVPEPPARRR